MDNEETIGMDSPPIAALGPGWMNCPSGSVDFLIILLAVGTRLRDQETSPEYALGSQLFVQIWEGSLRSVVSTHPPCHHLE